MCYIDHINWEYVTNQCSQIHNMPISIEDAKTIWHALAYDKKSETQSTLSLEDSDDEDLFQTNGKPFVVNDFIEYRNHQRCLSHVSEGHAFLSIEYPSTISSKYC